MTGDWSLRSAAAGVLFASVLAVATAAAAPGVNEGPAASAPTQASRPDDQTVYVVVGVAHSDIVIPRAAFANAPTRVRIAVGQLADGPWIVVGWGPYWFGRDGPGDTYGPLGRRTMIFVWTLLDPQVTSRLRVAAIAAPGAAPAESYVAMIPVRLSSEGLGRAVERINQTFAATPSGDPVVAYLPPGKPNVRIFLSNEPYSLAHECNHWIASVLHAGGVRLPPMVGLTPETLALALRAVSSTTAPRPPASDPKS